MLVRSNNVSIVNGEANKSFQGIWRGLIQVGEHPRNIKIEFIRQRDRLVTPQEESEIFGILSFERFPTPSDILASGTPANLIAKEMRWSLAVIRDPQSMSLGTNNGFGNEFRVNPSSLTVYDRFGIQESGVGSLFGSISRPSKDLRLLPYRSKTRNGYKNAGYPNENQIIRWQVCRSNQATEVTFRMGDEAICLLRGFLFISERKRTFRVLGSALLVAATAAFLVPAVLPVLNQDNQQSKKAANPPFHTNTLYQRNSLRMSPNQKPKKAGFGRRCPKGAPRLERFSVRVTPDELKAIESAAEARKQSVSEWIRSTLNAAL